MLLYIYWFWWIYNFHIDTADKYRAYHIVLGIQGRLYAESSLISRPLIAMKWQTLLNIKIQQELPQTTTSSENWLNLSAKVGSRNPPRTNFAVTNQANMNDIRQHAYRDKASQTTREKCSGSITHCFFCCCSACLFSESPLIYSGCSNSDMESHGVVATM